jgi:hypothetical protein
VTVEVDQQTHRVRATAMGAAEMHVKDASGAISEREARFRAARSLGLGIETLTLAAETPGFRVYQTAGDGPRALRAIDWQGAIRMQRSRALAATATSATVREAISRIWHAADGGDGPASSHPGLVLLYERHLVDLSGVEDLGQALALAASELEGKPAETPVALVAMPAGIA